jgi:poly(beta-D-mannuronate) lyase
VKRAAKWFLPVLVFALFASVTSAVAEEAQAPVASPEAFARAIAAARPGDTIVIAAGRHDGWRLEVPATVSGASGRAISIRGATPGGVTFTGKSQIHIRGNHIELADLVFEETGAPSVAINGNHNRVTRVDFIRAGTRRNTHRPILRIEAASNNEIDHCSFVGSASVSIQVKVPRDERRPLALYNHLHHNLFKDIPRYSKNGQEPIQLKCDRSRCELMTRVEYNRFVRADGDDELVSVKSSRNVIRYNIASDSSGGIYLRVGGDNLVEGNVLIRTKRGIVVMGDHQTVINNFIDHPRLEGILVAVGSKRFRAATHSVLAHNTVVRARMPIRFALHGPEGAETMRDNKIVNNIFVADRSTENVMSSKARDGVAGYLTMNEVRRNIFWWHDGAVSGAIVRTYESTGNIVADPLLDLSDPMVPRLRPESPARQHALTGYGATDLIGTARDAADLPDIGAVEASVASGG